jgi:hypothetical protein
MDTLTSSIILILVATLVYMSGVINGMRDHLEWHENRINRLTEALKKANLLNRMQAIDEQDGEDEQNE